MNGGHLRLTNTEIALGKLKVHSLRELHDSRFGPLILEMEQTVISVCEIDETMNKIIVSLNDN